MINSILGIKKDQSQAFDQDGKRIPVTVIEAGPCWVSRITNGGSYRSVQLAFGTAKHIGKALSGHMHKAGLDKKPRFLREIRTSADVKVGDTVKVDQVFQAGDKVRVTGVSKGKGFAGVVKRHGFTGGPRTHGQSDRERAPGSIGQTTTPGRVYRGKRMAGRMGTERVTIERLTVVAVDPARNTLTVKGLVPGARNGLLVVSREAKTHKNDQGELFQQRGA